MRKALTGLAGLVVVVLGGVWLTGWLGANDEPHAYAPVTDEDRAAARAYLERAHVPLPDGWRWSTFEREPGIPLRSGRVDVADPKGIVVLVPGHTAPLDLHGLHVLELTTAGYSVAGLEQRGQGLSWRPLSNPEKSHQTDYADLSADLAAYVASLGTDLPVFVLGTSMGGHIALRAAGENAMKPRAMGLVVPMVDIQTGAFPYPVARAITSFYAHTGLGANYTPGAADWAMQDVSFGTPSACNPNPDTADRLNALRVLDERLRVRGATNQWVHATMASVRRIREPAFLAAIDVPTFMVTAGREAYVSTPAARAACDAMGSCTRRHFEEAAHCITNEDPARGAAILKEIAAFFDERL